MRINIGCLIKDELRRQGHNNAWFADRLGVNVRTVNKIFQKQTIDTQQLYMISKVLGRDFFESYSSELSSDMRNGLAQ